MNTRNVFSSLKAVQLILIVSLVFFFVGCPLKAPIKKPSTSVNPGSLGFSSEQLNLLIQSGITAAGWHTVSNRPGEILAEVSPGNNRVIVSINYTVSQYEITHRESSPGIKYNSHTQTVHNKYNELVDSLDRAIQSEITRYFVGKMAELNSQKPTSEQPATPPIEQPDGGPPVTENQQASPTVL